MPSTAKYVRVRSKGRSTGPARAAAAAFPRPALRLPDRLPSFGVLFVALVAVAVVLGGYLAARETSADGERRKKQPRLLVVEATTYRVQEVNR